MDLRDADRATDVLCETESATAKSATAESERMKGLQGQYAHPSSVSSYRVHRHVVRASCSCRREGSSHL